MNQSLITSQDTPLSTEAYKAIVDLVYEHSRIKLGADKKALLSSRLGKRLRHLKLASFDEYCDILRSHSSQVEIDELIDLISTNHTRFYREPDHFVFLTEKSFLNCFRNSPQNDPLCESGLPHHLQAKNPTPCPSSYRNFFDLIHLSTGRFGHPTSQKPFWKLPNKASTAWKSSNLFQQTSSSVTSKKALTPKKGNAESRPSCAKKFNSNASISSKMNIQSPTIKTLSFAGM